MKDYELAYLISSDLSKEEVKPFQDKIISFIQNEGGALIENVAPLKKILSYPIKKQTQAYLAVLNFQLNPEKLADFEKKIKAEVQILRYLILIKPKPKEVKAVPKKFVPKKAPERKVELKEIEKKLEEILGQEGSTNY